MRWYSNPAVQQALASAMQGREVIWAQFPNSGDKAFWVRRTQVKNEHSIEYWTTALNREFNSIGIFIGSNIINWEAVDIQPPPLRAKSFTRHDYTDVWKQYLTPEGCAERGLDWNDIWVSKTLVFDFDSPLNPMKSFHKADQVSRYLHEQGCTPYMVFSGSKGFHIHLNREDSERLVGFKLSEYSNLKDPLKKIGQLYAQTVVDICKEAGISYDNEDRSPNFRQGIVRCPYSVHPKTGQIVFPLDAKNLADLRKHESLTIEEIAKVLHPWDINCQSYIAKDYDKTFITPEYKMISRGLPAWSE